MKIKYRADQTTNYEMLFYLWEKMWIMDSKNGGD